MPIYCKKTAPTWIQKDSPIDGKNTPLLAKFRGFLPCRVRGGDFAYFHKLAVGFRHLRSRKDIAGDGCAQVGWGSWNSTSITDEFRRFLGPPTGFSPLHRNRATSGWRLGRRTPLGHVPPVEYGDLQKAWWQTRQKKWPHMATQKKRPAKKL